MQSTHPTKPQKSLSTFDFALDERAAYVSPLSAPKRQTPTHAHKEGQLFYCESGSLQVKVNQAIWFLPSTRALWVPPHTPHSAWTFQAIKSRTLYSNPQHNLEHKLQDIKVIFVSPLLKECILEINRFSMEKPLDQFQINLTHMVLDLIARSEPEQSFFVAPRDKRLEKAILEMLRLPSQCDLAHIAKKSAASIATIKRLFKQEFDLGFSAILQQIKIAKALEDLSTNLNLTEVGLKNGYESPASFSRAFKQVMGISPKAYRQKYLSDHKEKS